MAEYHYKYDPPQRGQTPNGGEDLLGWLIVVAALFVFPPLGLLLLLRKLMSASTTSNRRSTSRFNQTGSTYHYTYTYNPNQSRQAKRARPAAAPAPEATAATPPAGAAATPATSAAPSGQPTVRKLAGSGFIAGGSVMTGLFGFSLVVSLADAIGTGALGDSLGGLLAMGCFTGIGLVLLYVGLFRRKRSKMFRKYQALIGRRESVNISTLVNATGRSYKKVCDELQDMLDFGVLPMGYLDLANDKLVLTSQGIADQPQAETRGAEDKEEDDDAILAQIKRVNDAIPDPVMSAKIDRIGVLTGKILDYQRQNPDKDSQLRSFLNYYLPTTLKILRAYAQLDQQGIEGENISAAKARIEGMMDKVVEGFEKQLDKLFRDEALDITSDVSVLEKMLDKDGLGQGGGLRLES